MVLAVLVGVPFVLDTDGRQADSALSAQAPNTLRDESASPFLGDLGDLGDRDGLRLRLTGGGNDTYSSAPMEPGPSPVADGGFSAPLPSGSPAGGGLAGSAQRSGSPPAAATSPGGETTTAAAKDAKARPGGRCRQQHSGTRPGGICRP